MNYLFIGGHADGKWIGLPDGTSVYHAPYRCGYDTYYAVRLAGCDGEVFTVYAQKDLSGSDVMRHLITNYQPLQQKAVSA